MDSEAYSYGLSDSASASASRSSKSQSHFYFDYEEVDGDDDLNSEYPCPFCPEEFDLVELCCHIDDEHPVEANFGICPICSTNVGENMVGHITMQHGDVFNSQQRLKFHKDDFPQSLSFERKELEDDHIRILSGFSSLHSTSKMAPDPLLSFLCNAPVSNESKTVPAEPSSKEKLEEKDADNTLSEGDVQLSSIPDTNQEEKTRRCDFVRGMGVQTRNSNDRLRTVWTPEMDRYFIDLMLEQVDKGNKFDDHLFSKRAWKNMISLFNSKFRFEYEKDVLKNRHKTLRNLYKAVKNLLDQRGFSWDEVRQMVTADNNVWDEYLKAHPEARSFRIKSIPYYNDLCIIYGDTTVEQKRIYLQESSHSGENEAMYTKPLGTASEGDVESLQEIMIGEDYKISLPGNVIDEIPQHGSNITATTTICRSRTYWQPPMDRFFIDLMLEQVQKGNQIDGIFRKQSWSEMIASFNAKFGFNYDVDVLKNRYKTLRRQYNVIKNLLDLDGFLWDETRQMITADDYVWQDYIKGHTDARQFMTRPIPYYKDLCVICDPSFDERDCLSGQGIEQHHDAEDGKLSIGFQSPVTSVSSEEQASVKESTHLGPKNKRELESMSSFNHNKKLRGEDESMASALREMASVVSSLSEKKNDDNLSSISIETVIEAIQALPNMDEDLVLDACDLLEDERKAKTFIALDVKLRRKWLIRKLRPQG